MSRHSGKPPISKEKLRARKSLSQNFLVDSTIADKIVEAVPFKPGDVVYEIGSGKGFITERFVQRGAVVWAIEKDRRMVGMLRKKFGRDRNVSIHHADILDLPVQSEPPAGAWLVGNLPFGIGTPILQWIFDHRKTLRGAVVTLQREVVNRLLAPPKDSDRSALSVWFQARGRGQRIVNIPPKAFVPPPRVTSTVMRIEFVPETPGVEGVPGIEYIVRSAFAQKRKVIANNLRLLTHLTPEDWTRLHNECGDLLRRRAEELHADDFIRLAKVLRLADRFGHDRDTGGDNLSG
ncbi:MAG: 16S rRNA (adenine(1518)-N(6)/adenine(1519)-N(6)) -dimethyltransferase RsmA [Candidatus Zixiibacteriota bacterium]